MADCRVCDWEEIERSLLRLRLQAGEKKAASKAKTSAKRPNKIHFVFLYIVWCTEQKICLGYFVEILLK